MDSESVPKGSSAATSQLPYICSTPKSTRNELSASFSNLSEIEGFSKNASPVRKRKSTVAESDSSRDLTTRFTLGHNLSEFFQNLNVSKDSNKSSSVLESFDATVGVKKKYKQIRKGQDWNLFKPKKMEGIYNGLISNQDYKKEIHNWIQHVTNDRNSAIIEMIQFIADVCGFQDLDVATVWRPKDTKISEALMKHMETHPPKLSLETGKYLFKAVSHWGRYIQTLICDFMQYFLEMLLENDLEFEDIMDVLAIIISFGSSNNRSMRHTATVLIMKWNTTILNIQAKVKYIKYYGFLGHAIQQFSTIIQHNCGLEDAQLEMMKIVCAEEMILWFSTDPSLICNSKYFNRLMRFVQNQSKKLRNAALKTCYTLLTIDSLTNYLKPLVEVFAKVVGDRALDIDYNIAILAVRTCTLMLDKFDDVFEEAIRNKIIYLIFGKHSLLAMAAGEFLIRYLSGVIEDPIVIKLVCCIHSLHEVDLVGLLVEATLDCCPELKEWAVMINYLLDDKDTLGPELQTILICVLSESVQQCFLGKCKILRIKTYERQFKVSANEITDVFITKISELLEKYQTDSLGLQKLLEILLIMNFEEVALSANAPEIHKILSVIGIIFAVQEDTDVLELISKFFDVMSDNNVFFVNKYQEKIRTLMVAAKGAVNNNIQQLNKANGELWMLRILQLFKYNNLNEVTPFHFFMKLVQFMEINNFTSNAIGHCLKCCYHSLKWKLTDIIDNVLSNVNLESTNEEIAETKKHFDKFTQHCFRILTETQELSLSFAVFECICEVHVKFKNDSAQAAKQNDVLSTLIPVIENPMYIRQFMECITVILFEVNSKETLYKRRFLLGKVFDLIHLNVIGFTESTKLLYHYHSHHDQYGDIFESVLKLIQTTSTFAYSTIIIQTLIYSYSQYLLLSSKNEHLGDFLKDLLALSERFQLLLNRSVSQSRTLLQLGIKYAVTSEKHYMFLNTIKTFSKPLSSKDKETLVDLVMATIPEKNKNNEHIKNFLSYLKNKTAAQRPAAQKNASTSLTTESTSYSNDNYKISSDDSLSDV